MAKNITFKNGKIVIEIDATPEAFAAAPLSSTGKSKLLATLGVDDTIKVGDKVVKMSGSLYFK